ncbi:Hsp33 family molecular chaperone HslO [Lacticaseibacillus casei]|uniref:Hsp33 family molecular chaperone HslO n=1 Tax=Lacticaseibacillus casei TaxID=1582 RepID=UPI0011086BBA|nr:Hsp33 family molecular chaperone HslO [Lacticaseibacillus casei]TLQ50340.1 Hsp33 family molecular chaperone HslO [Lacticaseibacillus casei]
MSDYIASALSRDTHFRIFAVDATETVREAQRRHDTWSAASAALGRTLVATALLSASGLKNRDDMLTVRIKGDGPVGSIITDGTEIGTVRGYVQEPHVNLPLNLVGKIDVARAVGKHGMLAVTKDIGIGEPFTGQVPLVSGEIAEDFTYYLAKSEQIPAAVGLSVFVNADNSVQVAGGFMLQALPGADDAELSALEANVKTLPLVSELLKSGLTPEQIIQRIAGDAPVQFLDTHSLRFACNCSKAHFGDIMATLPHEQLQEMIDEDGGAETTCKFCGNQYHYSVAYLEALITRHE